MNVGFLVRYKKQITFLVSGLLVCLVCAGVWLELERRSSANLERFIEKEGLEISDKLKLDLARILLDMERFTNRWELHGGLSKHEFQDDAQNYIRDVPGIQAIEWVDTELMVNWVVPLKGNEQAVGLDLSFEKNRYEALVKSKNERYLVISKPINLVQGGTGILIYHPLYVADKFDGFILTVLKTQNWLNQLLLTSRPDHVGDDFEISISIGSEILFETWSYASSSYRNWTNTKELALHNQNFTISIRPTEHFISHSDRQSNSLIVLVLFVILLLLGFIFYLVLNGRYKKQELNQALAVLEAKKENRTQVEYLTQVLPDAQKYFRKNITKDARASVASLLEVIPHLDESLLSKNMQDQFMAARKAPQYLMALLNQFASFTVLEEQELELKDVDFNIDILVSSLFDLLHYEAKNKDIQLDYKIIGSKERWFSGDVNYMRQIIYSLILATITRVECGALIVLISIIGEKNKSSTLTFEISYSDDENQSSVKEPATTLKNEDWGSEQNIEFCQALVKTLGGSIQFEETSGAGFIYTLILPVKLAFKNQTQIFLSGNTVTVPAMNILLAEDSKINQLIITEMLEQDGHSVLVAKNGAEAVEMVRANASWFNLILMDVQMPVMNGIDATIGIRDIVPDERKLPVVALTANSFKTQMDSYLSVGMQFVLSKPLVNSDLRTMLATVVRFQAEGPPKTTLLDEGAKQELEGLAEDCLDTETLLSLANLMPSEQLRLLIDSAKGVLTRNLPEIMNNKVVVERKADFAHEISGTVSNLGMKKLASFSANLEVRFLEGDDCFEEIQTLSQLSEISLRELDIFLKRNNANKSVSKGDLDIDRSS
jgi:CheY-like chemotaxis protein/CHASE1-domain containing sensor protein